MNDRTTNERTSRHRIWIVLLAALVGLTACGDEDGTANASTNASNASNATTNNTSASNVPPEAVIDVADGPFAVDAQIELDASDSSDLDGQELSFEWTVEEMPQNAQPQLLDADSAQATLVPDVAGDYAVTVTVSDGIAPSTASVDMSVLDSPVADAGADATVEVGTTHTFDATASDAAGGELTYSWSFVSKPDASSAALMDADTAMPSVNPDEPGSYIAEVTVDNGVGQDTDRATLEATPTGGIVDSTVWVSPDGDDSNVGTEEAPLATIDAAITKVRDVESADQIELMAGTYDVGNESWEISSDLDISGPLLGSTATISGEADTMFKVIGDAFLTISSVEIVTPERGFEVENNAALSFIEVTCRARICITSGDLLGTPGGRLQVVDSTLTGDGDGANSTHGITTVSPDELTVTDSTITGFGTDGILVANGSLTMSGSEVSDNGTGLNLVINDSTNPTDVSNTDFVRNDTGVASQGADNITVRNSTFEEHTADAITVEDGAVVVRDSDVTAGDADGVEVAGNAIFTARDSTFDDNADAGVRVVGEGARVDLGTENDDGNNALITNGVAGLYDERPAGSTGTVEMSATTTLFFMGVGLFPPAGTYSGPGYDENGIQIVNDNEVVVH